MEKLIPAQWKESIIRDIKRRQELRKKGIKDADNFLEEHKKKANKTISRIRCKSYRGN